MNLARALLIAIPVCATAACGAGSISPGDLPEPGQAVAFARIEVEGIRMSRLAIHRAVEGGTKRGMQIASIRARQGTHTYAVYLEPGQYAVHGVLDSADLEDGVPTGMGGVLLFDITPKRASYFGSFRMLTGFQIANAVTGTDRMAPAATAEQPGPQPEPDAAPGAEPSPEPEPEPGDSFEEEWQAAPTGND
jgi:hypothetical protein